MLAFSSPVVVYSLFFSLVSGTSSSRHTRSIRSNHSNLPRASVLDEVEAIQATVTFLICQIGQQGFSAAEALGISGKSAECIVPGSAADYSTTTTTTTTVSQSNTVTPVKVVSNAAVNVQVVAAAPVSASVVVAAVGSTSSTAEKVVSVVPTVAGVANGQIQANGIAGSQTRTTTIPAVVAPTPVVAVVDPNICTYTNPQDCINQAQALKAHNEVRATHHAPPLTWNNDLAAAALRWAQNGIWKHSGGSLFPSSYVYGENLYSSTLPAPATSMTDAINAYANEEAQYDYSNPGYSDEVGHFTQVVWVATEQVGCAIINVDLDIFHQYTNSSAFSVCCYHPSGNYLGEFAANVLKP